MVVRSPAHDPTTANSFHGSTYSSGDKATWAAPRSYSGPDDLHATVKSTLGPRQTRDAFEDQIKLAH